MGYASFQKATKPVSSSSPYIDYDDFSIFRGGIFQSGPGLECMTFSLLLCDLDALHLN